MVKAQERYERESEKVRTTRQQVFKEAQEAGLSLAEIGHAFTTFCAGQRIPVRIFMEWVGHEDYETMMIYNHYSPGGFELDMLNAAAERDALERELGPIRQAWISPTQEVFSSCGPGGFEPGQPPQETALD